MKKKRKLGRKTSSAPSRIYSYGAFAPKEEGLVEEQMRLAHRYRNKHVEIEIERRARIRDIVDGEPTVAPLVGRKIDLEAALEASRTAIKSARAATRSRKGGTSVTESTKDHISTIVAELRKLDGELKSARAAVYKDPVVKARLDAVQEAAGQQIRDARAASGLYWGTYLLVEAAAKQMQNRPSFDKEDDPSFRPYDGGGRVGVQIQSSASEELNEKGKPKKMMGMTVARLFSGLDTRIRIDPEPHARDVDRPWKGRGGVDQHGKPIVSRKKFYDVSLRVGSTESGAPLWAKFCAILHRPLPFDAIIKAVWLRRERIGTKMRYELQFSFEAYSFIPLPHTRKGVAAINFGWRLLNDGDLRVGVLADDKGGIDQIKLPCALFSALDHVDSLRAIRDRNFNKMRNDLVKWFAGDGEKMPPEVKDLFPFLPTWKSQGRLARAVLLYGEIRRTGKAKVKVEGQDAPVIVDVEIGIDDSGIFLALAAWAKQDRHLYAWEAHERDKCFARRKDIYRNVAKNLALRYGKIIVDGTDFRDFAELPLPEDSEVPVARVRWFMKNSAVGEFRAALIAKCASEGTITKKQSPYQITMECRECGKVEERPERIANIHLTCGGCGKTWDQDENAALNLLARASSDVGAPTA